MHWQMAVCTFGMFGEWRYNPGWENDRVVDFDS